MSVLPWGNDLNMCAVDAAKHKGFLPVPIVEPSCLPYFVHVPVWPVDVAEMKEIIQEIRKRLMTVNFFFIKKGKKQPFFTN